MLYVGVGVLVVLVALVVWKREQVKALLGSLKKEPTTEQLAAKAAKQEKRELNRRYRELHPSRFTLFVRHTVAFLGVLGTVLLVGALCAIVGVGFFHFGVVKSCGLEGAGYISVFAACVFFYGGTALTWVFKS